MAEQAILRLPPAQRAPPMPECVAVPPEQVPAVPMPSAAASPGPARASAAPQKSPAQAAAVPGSTPASAPDERPLDDLAAEQEFLGRVASLIDKLPEVKSTHGLAVLVGLRQSAAQGRRPVTCGEAQEFLGRARQLSPAGSRKIVRKLIELGHAVPVPNPCIDKAVDLHAGPVLARLLPVIAKPHTLHKISRDGSLARRKFDIAWLSPRRVAAADQRMAEWASLWEKLRPTPDRVPTSLAPFFRSDLSKRPSPIITAIVSVVSDNSWEYEFLVVDGPALEDPPFEKAGRKRLLGNFRCRALANALRADFYEAKVLATPLFHRLKGDIGGHQHDYFRLVLPISTCDGKVDCLLVISELAKNRPNYDKSERI
jgi:hypothetical protein